MNKAIRPIVKNEQNQYQAVIELPLELNELNFFSVSSSLTFKSDLEKSAISMELKRVERIDLGQLIRSLNQQATPEGLELLPPNFITETIEESRASYLEAVRDNLPGNLYFFNGYSLAVYGSLDGFSVREGNLVEMVFTCRLTSLEQFEIAIEEGIQRQQDNQENNQEESLFYSTPFPEENPKEVQQQGQPEEQQQKQKEEEEQKDCINLELVKEINNTLKEMKKLIL